MGVLTSFEQKVRLAEVQQEHLAPITPLIDSREATIDEGRMAPKSCDIADSTPYFR